MTPRVVTHTKVFHERVLERSNPVERNRSLPTVNTHTPHQKEPILSFKKTCVMILPTDGGRTSCFSIIVAQMDHQLVLANPETS
jgi:hypothetical protein